MTTTNGTLGELPAAQRTAVTKCEQVVEEYRRRRIARASAVRSLTAALSTAETGLDDAAIDETLDSYLIQLDDTDRIRKEAGKKLQQHFRGHPDSQQDVPGGGADPQNQNKPGSQSTLQSRPMSKPPRPADPAVARKERSRSPSYEPSSDGHRDKRRRPDPDKFAWAAPEAAADELLRPELRQTLQYLREYRKDVKFSQSNLINSAGAPEFPDDEWTNVFSGNAVNLDHVLSSLYTLSSGDKHIEHVGDVELRYGTVAPVKTVQSSGDWVIAWQRTALATIYTFPHRRAELDAYHTHIFGLFSAVDQSLHQRVIHYNQAVQKRIGSVRNLLLSDYKQFSNLRTQWIDSCGANVVSSADTTSTNSSMRSWRKACIRWNKGICTAHPSDCRYHHVCSLCGGKHTKRDCKRD